MQIVVVGSLNADLVQRVERFPRPGETVVGSDLAIVPGGKGANQAYAAALLGGSVQMLGRVGSDSFGSLLIENLRQAGVDTAPVEVSSGASGTASILVLPTGENVIIISPGANARLSPEDVARRLQTLPPGSVLLTQLEVPLASTKLALEIARRRGAITILDPAPAQTLPAEILRLVDFLTPNQTEAALLLGSDNVIEDYQQAEEAARQLVALGPSTVILKLGHLGVVMADAQGTRRIPGFSVKAVDSTAAGDAFNGAFAVALAEGRSPSEAARFANAAGALSVTRHGAQTSIPSRPEVNHFLLNP